MILGQGDVLNPSRDRRARRHRRAEVDVFARPRVAILSTGNEIVEPGQPLGARADLRHQSLHAVGDRSPRTAASPVLCRRRRTRSDDARRGRAVAPPVDDIIVFSGGSSVGERDLIIDVLAAFGEVIFHGIAVKPGKPTVFGRVGRQPVFGMPGYPTSCLSNAYMLLVPLLRRMARLPEYQPRTATAAALAARRLDDRAAPVLYRADRGRQAVPAFKASGDITSMSQADGYIEIPAQTDIVEAGEMVDVKLF